MLIYPCTHTYFYFITYSSVDIKKHEQNVVEHTCNPSTLETEAVGLIVSGQPALPGVILSQTEFSWGRGSSDRSLSG
jgi:hypothetical protein